MHGMVPYYVAYTRLGRSEGFPDPIIARDATHTHGMLARSRTRNAPRPSAHNGLFQKRQHAKQGGETSDTADIWASGVKEYNYYLR